MDKNKLNATKKFQRYYCTLCDIYTNSDNQLNEHLKGIRHHINKRRSTYKHDNKSEMDYEPLIYIPMFIMLSITTYVYCYVIVNFCN